MSKKTLEESKLIWKNSLQFWGGTPIRKRELSKVLKFNYLSILENVPMKGWKLTYSPKKLLSVSSIMKSINDFNLYNVPNSILEERKYLGSKFMSNCLALVNNKDLDLNSLNINELERKHLNTFFNWLIENEMKILHCEKLFTNGSIVGFVDFIVRDKNSHMFILEVKIRNSLQERQSDIFQVMTYCSMVGIPGKLVIIGDNGEIKVIDIVKSTQNKKMLRQVQNFYKLFDIDIWFENRLQIGD